MMILALLFAGLLLGRYLSNRYETEFFGSFVTMLAGVLLLGAVLVIPLNRMEVSADLEQYRAVAETVERARAAGRDIENAALQLRIAEMNQWRAKALYWRRSAFGLWWPAEVETLEPIR